MNPKHLMLERETMVSSRRLAREWALKIHYQIDLVQPPSQFVFAGVENAIADAYKMLEENRMREAYEGVAQAFRTQKEFLGWNDPECDTEITLKSLDCGLETLLAVSAPLSRNKVTKVLENMRAVLEQGST